MCLLGDDLQDVEDELHDDGAFAQLTRPVVDDGDQGAVQVAQVLREEGLAVTSCQVTHLGKKRTRERERQTETSELEPKSDFNFHIKT